MRLYESAEDYLERILMIKELKGNVRSIDIANDMNFSKPSVSVAMHKLKLNGYITVSDDGYINLTEEGYKVASEVYERHRVISNLLISLGVSESQAREDACKIEHDLSQESFEALKNHLQNHGKL